MPDIDYGAFVRNRITELRIKKNVSEHRMSIDLDKSGSYIRNITSGTALPSLKEFFRIVEYLGSTPVEFFAPLVDKTSLYGMLWERLCACDETDLKKVWTFLDLIKK